MNEHEKALPAGGPAKLTQNAVKIYVISSRERLSNAQDLSNIVHRICSAFRGFLLRAVPCLRHENPLSVMKRNSTNMCG